MTTSINPRPRRSFRVAGLVAAAVALPTLAIASLAAAAPTPELVLSHVVTMPSHTVIATPSGQDRACPRNMAHVGSSCVDKFEGSLVEIHANGSETAFSAYESPKGKNVRAVSRAGVAPQAHISMVDAKRACAASGKRLCRANEWKQACKGPENTQFPYGNKRVANACVDTNRTSPMNKLHGGARTAASMNDPRANQVANTVENTGAAASCTNGYGVHDMVGNVHEWTDDGSFRGGYYLDTKLNGDGCDYRTTAHAPSYYDYSTGFRCCADEGFVGDE